METSISGGERSIFESKRHPFGYTWADVEVSSEGSMAKGWKEQDRSMGMMHDDEGEDR